MRHLRPSRAALVVLLAAATLAAACDQRPGGAATDSLALLSTRLKDAEQAGRDRETIAMELAQTTKLLDEIDGEMSKVKGVERSARKPDLSGVADPWVARHDSVMAKVRGVTALLAQSRARVATLERKNGAQSKELATYRETIASLEALSRRQTAEIAVLAGRVDSLRAANGVLVAEREQVREEVRGLRDTASTVYYVVGTRRQLIERGVVAEDGRKRFVVFGSRGLVPVRRLPRTAFARADLRQPLEIPLPGPGRKFHVISRHDASLLGVSGAADRVTVIQPEEFWAASRYLIIETQG